VIDMITGAKLDTGTANVTRMAARSRQ
jgi:hypothetical protein